MITQETLHSTAEYLAVKYDTATQQIDPEKTLNLALCVILEYLLDYHPETVQGVCEHIEFESEWYTSIRGNHG